MKDKKNLWTVLVMASVACILFLVCATIWDLFRQTELLPALRIMADSCTVPAVLYIGVSLLGWIGSKGTFDIFGYSIGGLFRLFSKDSYEKSRETFYDYRARKNEERKSFNRPMMAVGLIFLLIALALTVVFMILD